LGWCFEAGNIRTPMYLPHSLEREKKSSYFLAIQKLISGLQTILKI
jgi:hypothetical protein